MSAPTPANAPEQPPARPVQVKLVLLGEYESMRCFIASLGFLPVLVATTRRGTFGTLQWAAVPSRDSAERDTIERDD